MVVRSDTDSENGPTPDHEIREYAMDLKEKLKERKLEFFYIMAERADFKPMKGMRQEELEAMFAERISHYKKKLVGEISILVNVPKNESANDAIVSILIGIRTIDKEGKLNFSEGKAWTNRIMFYSGDLKDTKVSIKLVERLIRLTAKRVIRTDPLAGMKFSRLLKELEKKKLSIEDMDPQKST